MPTRRKFFSFIGLSTLAGVASTTVKAEASPTPGLSRVIYLNGWAMLEKYDFEYGGNGRFKFSCNLKGGKKPDFLSVQVIDNGKIRALTSNVTEDVPVGTWVQLFDDLANY